MTESAEWVAPITAWCKRVVAESANVMENLAHRRRIEAWEQSLPAISAGSGEESAVRCLLRTTRLRIERRIGVDLTGRSRRRRTESAAIDPSLRSNCIALAGVPEELFEPFLVACEANGSIPDTLELLRLRRATPASAGLEEQWGKDLIAWAAGRKFNTLLVDPPWKLDEQSAGEATSSPYGLAPATLAKLPLGSIASEVAHLHLWIPDSLLLQAGKLLAAWGFEYRGVFVWVTRKPRSSDFWGGAHGLLVLATRGRLPFLDPGVRSWLYARPGGVGSKPAAINAIVERVSPGPRALVFGAERVGWNHWQPAPSRQTTDAVG